MPLWLAAIVSLMVAAAAWRLGTLTATGAVAAWLVGTLVLQGTGWKGGAVLAAFFVSSSSISRLARSPASLLDAKGDRRDAWQVFANGGAAAFGAALSPTDASLGLWIVTASLAAAAADTWATALGSRSRVPPRLVGSWRIVPVGTSGGMTLLGSAGALIGALIVSATGALVLRSPAVLLAGTLIGFLGMVVDSSLGAFFQGRFHCPNCDEASEWRVHRCGAATTRRGGLAWLNNDGVNFVATALAACASLLTWGRL